MAAATHPPLTNLTLSTMRAPLSTPVAPALSTTLPTLSFNFDALRGRMAAFTQRFDAYIASSRSQVLEARAAYRLQLSRGAEEASVLQRHISEQEAKGSEHGEVLAAQQAESGEMRDKIRELEGVRDERRDAVDSLQTKLESIQSKLAGKRAGVKQREQYAGIMRGQSAEELEAWENALGMRIEGTGNEERVRFVFDVPTPAAATSTVAARNKAEACSVSFELDMAGLGETTSRGYQVVECAPRVDGQRVADILRRLSQDEQLGRFLGDMRRLLLDAAR